MAFDRFVTLHVDAGRPSSVIIYDNVRYSTFTCWGEFILAPVLMDVSQFGFRPAAAVNLRIPYNPIIVFGRYEGTPNNLWTNFDVDGIRYQTESLNVTNGNRFIELAGNQGVRISIGG